MQLNYCAAALQASQKMTNSLMLATCMMNIGTLFSVSAMASAATASFVGASAFGLISLINFAKVGELLIPCWPILDRHRCASAVTALCFRGCFEWGCILLADTLCAHQTPPAFYGCVPFCR